jgi:Domain of unknown function (DUF4129)
VLAREEFQPLRPSIPQLVLESTLDWIERVVRTILDATTGSPITTILLLVVIVGVLAAIGVLLARGVRRNPVRAVVVHGDIGRSPQDWEAQAHEAAGRWRQALRSRYRKLLAELAARGLIEEVPGRTSGEYLRESLDALPAAADDLRAVTAAFEGAWYGSREVSASDVAAVRDRTARIVSTRAPTPAGTAG